MWYAREKTPNLVREIELTLVFKAAVRTHNNGPRAWTLMGLLVRIAHALQLNKEESYSSLTFFQAQLHRRAWFCLLSFDFQASIDRGSDPAVPANSYNTKSALNLNDSDFGPESEMMWSERSDHTDMTFNTVASRTQRLLRQLSFVPVSGHAFKRRPIQLTRELGWRDG